MGIRAKPTDVLNAVSCRLSRSEGRPCEINSIGTAVNGRDADFNVSCRSKQFKFSHVRKTRCSRAKRRNLRLCNLGVLRIRQNLLVVLDCLCLVSGFLVGNRKSAPDVISLLVVRSDHEELLESLVCLFVLAEFLSRHAGEVKCVAALHEAV